MKIIPIFFTINDNYVYYLDCAIRSIMENANRDNEYRFIVLHEDVTEEHMATIKSAVKAPFSIEFIQMEEEYAGIEDRIENRLRCDYFTLSIYFRLFIADMFPQYDKGVYIDSDVIVLGDIAKLYDTDLGDNNIIAACPDFSIRGVPPFVAYVDKVVDTPCAEYVNSGILVMNLKMMREKKFSERFLYLLNKYHFETVAPDQDYINAICRGKIKLLDESWDAMPPMAGERPLLEKPNLIHFNLFFKPSLYDNVPYEEYFWKYAKQSPFYNDILAMKSNYTDEQRAADSDGLNLMLTNAEAIMKNDITLRHAIENGDTVRL